MIDTKVINLFGQPGASKSTTAAGLFYLMKTASYNVELVNELAKDITWEGHHNLLEDQLYLLANQNRKLERLRGKVDFVITDCPILLGLVYTPEDYYKHFSPLVIEVFDSYNNRNFFIKKAKPYVKIGRNQTEEEASKIADSVLNMLNYWKYRYRSVNGDGDAPSNIMRHITNEK